MSRRITTFRGEFTPAQTVFIARKLNNNCKMKNKTLNPNLINFVILAPRNPLAKLFDSGFFGSVAAQGN